MTERKRLSLAPVGPFFVLLPLLVERTMPPRAPNSRLLPDALSLALCAAHIAAKPGRQAAP